jgi:glycosyltransferase involved in cell wall biosynthesis
VTSTVLIPSFNRAAILRRCLARLAEQTRPPDEIIVVWQSDDSATRDAATSAALELPALSPRLRVVRSALRGVVPAENTALDAASGEIILLIDDDALAPPEWVQRHLAFYDDPRIGAVGGPADNVHPTGEPFPRRDRWPGGRLRWYGRLTGNMYDQPVAWRTRPAEALDHLVGYNMSLRRAAFGRFEEALRPYWQMFELDACMEVRRRGFRVMFDFGNVVEHHPTNTAYVGGRDGDLEVSIYNAAYNHSYILAKRQPGVARALAQRAYTYGVGTTGVPGLLGAIKGVIRFGRPAREWAILLNTWKARRQAERDARAAVAAAAAVSTAGSASA